MNESKITSLTQKLDNLQLTETNIQQIQKNLTEYTTNKKQVKELLIALYNILTKLSDDDLNKIVFLIDGAKHGGKIRKPRSKTKSKKQTKKIKISRKYKRKTIKKRRVKKGGVDDDISDISSDSSHGDTECSICLDTLEIIQPNVDHTKIRHQTGENSHYFHKYCIAKYVEMSNNIVCPTCRIPFSQNIIDEVGLVLTDDNDNQNWRQIHRDRAANILLIMTFVSVGFAVLVIRGQLNSSIFLVRTFFIVFRTMLYIMITYLSQIDQRYITAVLAFITFVFLRNMR